MTKVFVYMNKHATKANKGVPIYSVKALSGPDKGRVIARSAHVLLSDVRPRVSQAGQRRVLREGKKNVHAGLVGNLVSYDYQPFHGYNITYNPYLYDSFRFAAFPNLDYYGSEIAYLTDSGVKVLELKDPAIDELLRDLDDYGRICIRCDRSYGEHRCVDSGCPRPRYRGLYGGFYDDQQFQGG